MICYPEFRERGWQIAAGRPNRNANYARTLKAMPSLGSGPTPRPSRLSIPWTETVNGAKSGQTPATPRVKAAQNAGHATLCVRHWRAAPKGVMLKHDSQDWEKCMPIGLTLQKAVAIAMVVCGAGLAVACHRTIS